MEKTLDVKLSSLARDCRDRSFILADAKDADMAFGVRGLGRRGDGRWRSVEDFRDQIREIVSQGLVDIMLMSASTSEMLADRDRIFDRSAVTPAVRANDTTDIHIVSGAVYSSAPCRPFSSATIEEIQGLGTKDAAARDGARVNLGLYSMTFNNLPDYDLAMMEAFKRFRLEAVAKGFRYFLEVFKPNVPESMHGLSERDIPAFLNDHIARLLAGVPSYSRPAFLKIPYLGPQAMEELCGYDSSVVVGVMGGSAGTSYDAFQLLYDAKKYGARAALFGRKINQAEHQLSFVEHLRRVADDQLLPAEAVRSYHDTLSRLKIRPNRPLGDDLLSADAGSAGVSYGAGA